MRPRRNAIGFLVIAILSAGLLTGCFSIPSYPSQCAFGVADTISDRSLKQVAGPGESIDGSDDGTDVYYVPCGQRNYRIAADSKDRATLVSANAGNPTDGQLPVSIALTALFQVNTNKDALEAFYNLCAKYPCWTDSGNISGDTSSNFASEGWNGMLAENFSPAIDRTAQLVMSQFPADIWNSPERYGEVADAISASFQQELNRSTGTTTPFFCGYGSTASDCKAITFTVENISAPDDVEASYQNAQKQKLEVTQQQALIDQQIANTVKQQQLATEQAKLYGTPGYAEQQQLEACTNPANTRVYCVFGDEDGSQVQIPTGQ